MNRRTPYWGRAHVGQMKASSIKCSCGWSSGQVTLISDAVAAYNQHVTEARKVK